MKNANQIDCPVQVSLNLRPLLWPFFQHRCLMHQWINSTTRSFPSIIHKFNSKRYNYSPSGCILRKLWTAIWLIILLVSAHISEAACSGPGPIWSSTPDYLSLSNCVSQAARGDTINVLPGSSTWTSTLNITKELNLIGAGRDLVIITSSSPMIQITPDANVLSNNGMIKVSGFTFDGNATAIQFIRVNNSSLITPFRKLVVGNNRFRNSGSTSGSGGVMWIQGQIRGVIYSNIFDRVNLITQAEGLNNITEWMNGNFPLSYGTSDNLYYEDNTIQFTTSFSGADPGMVYSSQGGRAVFRYNTWDYTNTTASEVWDTHGMQNFPGNGQDSTMVAEYYGNRLLNAMCFRWLNHRGGWGLTFNNVATGTGGMVIQANQYAAGDIGGSGCDSVTGVTGGEINNTYTFNNTHNGVLRNMVPGPIGDGCNVSEANGSYRNYNASCTSSSCSAGIGLGTTAPTGTCTTGVGYWVASTEITTTNPSVVQSGTFYKCTSTNTWTAYYRPYTYPHPLITGNPASAKPNAPFVQPFSQQ